MPSTKSYVTYQDKYLWDKSDPTNQFLLDHPAMPKRDNTDSPWCKGIEGQEHAPTIKMHSFSKRVGEYCGWRDGVYYCHHILACHDCAKHLKTWIATTDCPQYREKV